MSDRLVVSKRLAFAGCHCAELVSARAPFRRPGCVLSVCLMLATIALSGCSADGPALSSLPKVGVGTGALQPSPGHSAGALDAPATGGVQGAATRAQGPAAAPVGAGGAARSASAADAVPPAAIHTGASIVGFRTATVVLYESDVANSGQRIPAHSIALPLKVNSADLNRNRLPVATVYGLRWIPRADVVLN